MRLVLLLLLAFPCYGAPKEPLKLPHFDTGWWARAHWAAAGFDYGTTGSCAQNSTCRERDPVARQITGAHPQDWRLALGFVGESAAVSMIQNQKLRRVVQVGLIGVHLAFGSYNLRRAK